MSGRYIDFHTHSLASDGTDAPRELIRKAAAVGLAAVALTDHDSMDGLDEAEREASRAGIRFVRGLEIAVRDGPDELHLVGLWMPRPSKRMRRYLSTLKENRNIRNQAMLDELRRLGMPLSMDDLCRAAGREPAASAAGEAIPAGAGAFGGRGRSKGGSDTEPGATKTAPDPGQGPGPGSEQGSGRGPEGAARPPGSLGRPHMALAMYNKGYVLSRKQAFERYIGNGGKAFVPRKLSSPEEGIGLLCGEGATVALAHPCLAPDMDQRRLDDILRRLRSYGLTALEAYHSVHTPAQVRMCVDLAEKHGLLLSGGSDYHGGNKECIHLGVGMGSLRVPLFLYEKMRDHRKKAGLPA
ncbi:PHP domain-containing protein [Desulfovibrio sp. OttesenSCG-928-A18]|nr:PHP domain-containing protein [Desulfovibrio sp. OttesenSCG-928-A18]